MKLIPCNRSNLTRPVYTRRITQTQVCWKPSAFENKATQFVRRLSSLWIASACWHLITQRAANRKDCSLALLPAGPPTHQPGFLFLFFRSIPSTISALTTAVSPLMIICLQQLSQLCPLEVSYQLTRILRLFQMCPTQSLSLKSDGESCAKILTVAGCTDFLLG